MITAGHVEVTGLPVQREPSQVHGAAAQQARPDAVEDVTVREDPDVEVGGEDLVEPRHLLVPEEGVRHPDLARVSEGEVADLIWREMTVWRDQCGQLLTFHPGLELVLEHQSPVVPSLPQSYGEVVFLHSDVVTIANSPGYHRHVADGREVSDEDIDVDESGGDGLVPTRRPQSGVVHFRPEDLVQDPLLHLPVVDDLPVVAPVSVVLTGSMMLS